MTRLTIISFSAGFDSAIMLNVEMWKCCQFQCCQFQFQPPIFFFVVITLAERMRDNYFQRRHPAGRGGHSLRCFMRSTYSRSSSAPPPSETMMRVRSPLSNVGPEHMPS